MSLQQKSVGFPSKNRGISQCISQMFRTMVKSVRKNLGLFGDLPSPKYISKFSTVLNQREIAKWIGQEFKGSFWGYWWKALFISLYHFKRGWNSSNFSHSNLYIISSMNITHTWWIGNLIQSDGLWKKPWKIKDPTGSFAVGFLVPRSPKISSQSPAQSSGRSHRPDYWWWG